MTWLPYDTWIVVVAVFTAVSCALPGCFLVLRKISMMGDAISHAVLPGLAIGYLVSGSRTSILIFLGAVVAGILTAWFTQWISERGRVEAGASMGIVFTALFAVGLILIVQGAERVDLDPDCVLYGALELVPLDVAFTFATGQFVIEVPRAAVTLSVILLVNTSVLLLLFKEFRISAFDPALAEAQGIFPRRMHYLLMTMVAVTTVAAFEAVGSIMVIAMLIVPPATAQLLTRRLGPMLLLSAALAALAGIFGHLGALLIPPMLGFEGTNTAGMMATMAGLLFLICATGTIIKRKHAQDAVGEPTASSV